MRFCLILLLSFSFQLTAKIRFLTFHCNNPDFIEMQDRTLKKFMQESYELIVFNDASSHEMEREIRSICEQLGILCVRFEQQLHLNDPLNQYLQDLLNQDGVHSHLSFDEKISEQPSVRHCHVIQFALDHYGYDHDDLVVIMDGDIFPIRPIPIREWMNDCQMLGPYKYIAEQNVAYFWVPFIVIDMPKMPDKEDLKFHVDLIDDYIFDTGAHTYYYLKKNSIMTKKYPWKGSTSLHNKSYEEVLSYGFTKAEAKFIKELPWPFCVEFHIEQHFLHFSGGSFLIEGHPTKAFYVHKFLRKITE